MLEIDVGNTFLKWRVLGVGGEVLSSGRMLSATISNTMSCPAEWYAVKGVRIASVASKDLNQRLTQLVSHSLGLSAQFAKTEAICAGVRCCYQDPSKMGVDRWLAILAAYHDYSGSCCIVDCGSAITIDLLREDGQHLGGYIVPGLRLMREALRRNTASVHFDEQEADLLLVPGSSTDACVYNGINLMFAGCAQQVASLMLEYKLSTLIITGGDGPMFHHFVGQGCYNEFLVMDGLKRSLP